MKAYWQLTWAQLLLFARNKNIIIWSLFLPIFMMLALGTLVGNDRDQFTLHVAMVDEDQTSVSTTFIKELERFKGIKPIHLTKVEALNQVKKGDIQLLLVVKKGFAKQLQSGKPTQQSNLIALYLDQSNPTVSQVGTTIINQAVDQLNKQRLQFKPLVTTEVVNVQSKSLTYTDFLVPGILAMMMMTNNLNGVAGTIASWRERGILRRMQSTPLKSSSFIAGQMTARILLNSVQAIAVLLVAYFVFDVKVYGSWIALISFILLGTLTFMSIGFIVASLARTPETAGPIAGLISFPMMFVGGIFFPVRELPGLLQPLVKAIPIGYLTEALRGVMNDGYGFVELGVPILVLVGWTVVSFTIAAVTFRWDVK